MRLPSLISALLSAAAVSATWVVPGGRWHTTSGELVNAHAGGVLFDEKSELYWWYGEYKIEGQEEGGGVSCYSSPDMVTWSWEGIALGKSFCVICCMRKEVR